MTEPLFDPAARRLRQARAERIGDPFLLDRAAEECLERLRGIARPIDRLLLAGPFAARWADRFGEAAAGIGLIPHMEPESLAGLIPGTFDAAVLLGGLDTADDPPLALTMIGHALKPDSPLIGTVIGGDSFALLRQALIAADRAAGAAAPRAHPRLDASTLAGLLGATGFAMPVVEVDRVVLRYKSLDRLVADLRGAGLTNQLAARPRSSPGKAWRARLRDAFESAADDGRVAERVDYLHFIGWSGHP